MKSFLKYVRCAAVLTVLMLVVCGLAYPAALTGLGQALFAHQANGSLITAEGEKTTDPDKAVGSAIAGQDFSGSPEYVQSRVSGVNYNTYTKEEKEDGSYSGVASGGSNLAPSSEELKKRVEESVEQFLKEHPDVEKGDIPADLLTASGSGLDPDITPEAARIQIPAIAAETGLSEQELEEIVSRSTDGKVFGVFGHERVNVLKCNLEIAEALGEL
ncbi:K(+)-transporting ATPase subunit C [[Clostridium] hylemonae]|uniref:Potassium-transporting ATPase KdpC subunit n=1 Tax=[Clostridium] hylemonae DSM 15053 TaxID=553973 RepID=C0C415_9FIRM|nr:K(+)-transporting ATPase subunit C [[Clostridium] hylemonae]EEG73089.1 K+-transporting ATPase, C subunit [[Clostridium] hylemonae DSM 15053]QEK17599.1 Potassium-transporting ATPase KdpC subunit [[Clostridium] hylemonae DSM 15053]